jgi:protein Tob/BTG
MKYEIEAASEWWKKQVEYLNILQPQQLELFKQLLASELLAKVKDHWYIDNPVRGSGYRSILVDDIQTDCLLRKTLAIVAGKRWEDVVTKLPRNLVMFVNPGRVSVRLLTSNLVHNVYSSQQTPSTP